MNPEGLKVLQLMIDGDKALEEGRVAEATRCAEQAASLLGNEPTAEVKELLGICYWLSGRREEAFAAFADALRLAQTPVRRAQILRSRGILQLGYSNDEALRDFNESCHILSYDSEAARNSERVLEYFVSVRFVGRAQLALGNRKAAYREMQRADNELRGHTPHELDNLMELLKVAPRGERGAYAKRAFALARRAGNRKCCWQIILLVARRPFPRRIVN
jgi:tetratricopeptide (TPR) repeat protein